MQKALRGELEDQQALQKKRREEWVKKWAPTKALEKVKKEREKLNKGQTEPSAEQQEISKTLEKAQEALENLEAREWEVRGRTLEALGVRERARVLGGQAQLKEYQEENPNWKKVLGKEGIEAQAQDYSRGGVWTPEEVQERIQARKEELEAERKKVPDELDAVQKRLQEALKELKKEQQDQFAAEWEIWRAQSTMKAREDEVRQKLANKPREEKTREKLQEDLENLQKGQKEMRNLRTEIGGVRAGMRAKEKELIKKLKKAPAESDAVQKGLLEALDKLEKVEEEQEELNVIGQEVQGVLERMQRLGEGEVDEMQEEWNRIAGYNGDNTHDRRDQINKLKNDIFERDAEIAAAKSRLALEALDIIGLKWRIKPQDEKQAQEEARETATKKRQKLVK